MKKNIRNSLVFVIVLSIGLVADQLSKYWAVSNKIDIELMPFVSLRLGFNKYIAFSLPVPEIVLWFLIPILLIVVGMYFKKSMRANNIWGFALIALLYSGAFGNIIDRMRLGSVIDFISVGSFPVFNLADSWITISIIIIVLFHKYIFKTEQ